MLLLCNLIVVAMIDIDIVQVAQEGTGAIIEMWNFAEFSHSQHSYHSTNTLYLTGGLLHYDDADALLRSNALYHTAPT